jgi:hypothetical protein
LNTRIQAVGAQKILPFLLGADNSSRANDEKYAGDSELHSLLPHLARHYADELLDATRRGALQRVLLRTQWGIPTGSRA